MAAFFANLRNTVIAVLVLAAIVFVSALVASPVGAAVSVRTQPRALLAILAGIVMLAAIRIAFTAVTGT